MIKICNFDQQFATVECFLLCFRRLSEINFPRTYSEAQSCAQKIYRLLGRALRG